MVLDSVSLREWTDQRGGDPRIRSIEQRLPWGTWVVRVSANISAPLRTSARTVQTFSAQLHSIPHVPGVSKCFISQIYQEKVSAIQIFLLSNIIGKHNG